MRLYSEILSILFIGHSLVAFDMPMMVQSFARSEGIQTTVDTQITNGAPLKYNWENSSTAQGTDARQALRTHGYDAVILTEGIPLRNHLEWSDTTTYAKNFQRLALKKNPQTQMFVYETWHSLNSGTGRPVEWDDEAHIPWRKRLDLDLPKWEAIVAALNEDRPRSSPPVRLIPAGQAFGYLNDEIAKGRVPGIRSIGDFFADDIHPNEIGYYFIALVQFATIYGKDPDSLPAQVEAAWHKSIRVPPKLAASLQKIVKEAVADHHR